MNTNQAIIKKKLLITIDSENIEELAYNITIKNKNTNQSHKALLHHYKENNHTKITITYKQNNQQINLTYADFFTLQLLIKNVEYLFYQLSKIFLNHPNTLFYLTAEEIITPFKISQDKQIYKINNITATITTLKDIYKLTV